MKNVNEMNKGELRAACKEAGIQYGKLTVGGMRDALNPQRLEEAKPVEVVAPVVSVEVQTEVEPVVVPATEQRTSGKGIKIEKAREERNGVKRPSEGGSCRAIWDYCDGVLANTGIAPTAGLVREQAIASGWNVNNASIELYQWRKFHGIRGRQPKA